MVGRGSHAGPRHRLGRLNRWRRGWRVALRLALRDVASHRGRSALIAVMVGVPVLLIGSVATWQSTTDISAEESMRASLGHAQAKILNSWSDRRIQQLPDHAGLAGITEEAVKTLPGQQPGRPWTTAQLAEVTGGRVDQVAFPAMFLTSGTTGSPPSGSTSRLVRLTALTSPSGSLPGSGLARLESGRWPGGRDEVLVSETGMAKGLPSSGPIRVRGKDTPAEHTLRVVGVGSAQDDRTRPVDVVADTSVLRFAPAESWNIASLVFRDRPVRWAEVREWNTYGLSVLSRDAVENPPPVNQLPADVYQQSLVARGGTLLIAALVSVGVLLETTLLAGPAFAVSAARNRRSLALISSNGAEPAQVRRYVLSQALVLGAGAALAGAVLAVGGGWALAAFDARDGVESSMAPFDVPWGSLAALALAAAASSVVAAVLPARGAGRVDIAAVLAGRERSLPVRRWGPTLGAAVATLSATVLVVSMFGRPDSVTVPMIAASVGLVVGVLFCIPVVLVLAGRASRPLPLVLRLPVRDAARQRSRSAPAIAAVAVTVAAFTMVAVTVTSSAERDRAEYHPGRPAGHGYVPVGSEAAAAQATVAEVRAQHPDWLVSGEGVLGDYERREGEGRRPVVAAVPRGCTPRQAISVDDDGTDPAVQRCALVGSNGEQVIQTVGVHPASAAGLPPRAATVLSSGGMVVADGRAVVDGHVSLAVGSYAEPAGDQRRVLRTVRVPAAVVSRQDIGRILGRQVTPDVALPGALLAESAAERLALPVRMDSYELVDPAGPISAADEQAVNDHVVQTIAVERGYVSTSAPVLWALLGLCGALVLLAALVATALAQAEAQADLATLAALGGTVGLRRRLVAGQAVLIALGGAVLGLASGLVAGAAVAHAAVVTRDTHGAWLAATVTVPWARLALVVVGVPVLAALLAATAVRRAPRLTRRLT